MFTNSVAKQQTILAWLQKRTRRNRMQWDFISELTGVIDWQGVAESKQSHYSI